MTTRLENLISDYITNRLTKDEIIRLCSDNEIHCPRPLLSGIVSKPEVLRVSLIHVKDDIDLDQKRIDLLNEIIRKAKNKTLSFVYYDPDARKKIDELHSELHKNGYVLSEGQFTKTTITSPIISSSENIKKLQSELRNENSKFSTEDIIGKSKELLESTFKNYCEKNQIAFDKDDDFGSLLKKTTNSIKLINQNVTKYEQTIKLLMILIRTPSVKINELRNTHGSGHGKESDFIALDKQTALFISNLALSISGYLESK